MSLICHVDFIRKATLKLNFADPETTATISFECIVTPKLAHDLTETLKIPCAVVFHPLQAKFAIEEEGE